jgi:predicted RNase H-like nuclease (RuvC/YqgF family)
VVSSINSAAKDANAASRELIDVVKSAIGASASSRKDGDFQPHELMDHIAKTDKMISEYEDKIEKKRTQKRELQLGETSDKQKKKITKLKMEIMDCKKMIKTLSGTINHQREQLEMVTKQSGEDDDIYE